jgi:microcystin-dependent protein
MSTEPFIGEVKLFGFNFAPKGYATCQGQILSIAQNTALFSLLGTTFGGNGQTTFGLPDLQGRAPVGQGQGPGLSGYSMGQIGGVEHTTLLSVNMPQHIHTLNSARVQMRVNGSVGDANSPDGAYLGFNANTTIYTETPGTNEFAAPAAVSGTTDISGGSQPFSILNPYLCMNYSIALQGIFPSRN